MRATDTDQHSHLAGIVEWVLPLVDKISEQQALGIGADGLGAFVCGFGNGSREYRETGYGTLVC